MKKYILPIILCSSSFLYAQTEVKGILSATEQTAIGFADLIFKSEEKIVDQISSDQDGNFSTLLEEGKYELIIEQNGVLLHSLFIDTKTNPNLGVILIPKKEQIDLDETIITTQKKLIEKKVDRLIFNPDQSEATKGGNALDALKMAPRIKVDESTDAVSIIGKGNVMVLINDRLSQMSTEQLTNYLKTIRAEDIEKIEIITNPPAKYDASGNSGVINIVLKTAANNSFNGNISANGNYLKYGNYSLNTGINYRKDRLTLSGRAFSNDGKWGNTANQNTTYPNNYWDANTTHQNKNRQQGAGLLIDYQLTDKLITGFNVDYTNGDGSVNSIVETGIYNLPAFDLNRYLVTQTGDTGWDWDYLGINYHIIHKFNEQGKKLTFDFDYSKNTSTDFDEMLSNEFNANYIPLPDRSEGNITSNDFKADHFNFSLDMEHPLKKWSMNYGTRIRFGNDETSNYRYAKTTGDYQEDLDYRYNFNYSENIYALYYSIEREFNEKWSAKLGLRYEHADVEGKSTQQDIHFKRQFDDLFPTAYVMYQPAENHSFSLNFSRRINRPSMWNLNPMVFKQNEYAYTIGNTELLPSYSSNYELEYAYKDLAITSLFLSTTDDIEKRITEVDLITQIKVTKPYNFAKSLSIGLSENINFKLYPWWKINASINAYYIKTTGKIPSMDYVVEGINSDLRINSNFELNKKKTLFANYSYSYKAKGQDEDMDKYNDYLSHNAGLRAMVFDKKLQIAFNVFNILKNHQPTYQNIVNDVRTRTINESIRSWRLSITYNFGKKFTIERSKSNQEQSGGK